MAVVDANGQSLAMPMRNDADAYIQLEAQLETLDPALNIGYAIFTDTGELLYWSYHTDTAESTWPQVHKGKFTLRGKLPSRLFNDGDYRIEFIAGIHFRQWILQPGINAPSIHISIQGGLSDSPYWHVKRPGMLAPVIQWELV